MTLPFISYSGFLCGSCSYCCWSAKVNVPSAGSDRPEEKAPNTLCRFQKAEGGCCIYGEASRPAECGDYVCSWVMLQRPDTRHRVRMEDGGLFRWNAHRPDTFQEVMAEDWVRAKGVMPLVPDTIPAAEAIRLIRETSMVPASSPVTKGEWTYSTGRVVRLRLLAEVADPEVSVRRWREALGDDDEGLPEAA